MFDRLKVTRQFKIIPPQCQSVRKTVVRALGEPAHKDSEWAMPDQRKFPRGNWWLPIITTFPAYWPIIKEIRKKARKRRKRKGKG